MSTPEPSTGAAGRSTELLDGMAARAVHEIFSQIKYGVPTEELLQLIVKSACREYHLAKMTESKTRP